MCIILLYLQHIYVYKYCILYILYIITCTHSLSFYICTCAQCIFNMDACWKRTLKKKGPGHYGYASVSCCNECVINILVIPLACDIGFLLDRLLSTVHSSSLICIILHKSNKSQCAVNAIDNPSSGSEGLQLHFELL